MGALFGWIDLLLFFLCALFTAYLLLFSLFSLRKKKNSYPPATNNHRFLVLFPAYREDLVIVDSVLNFKKQFYPESLYTLVVISDKMTDQTVDRLRSVGGIQVLIAQFESSSKAAALNLAMNAFCEDTYDAVVVMDADNHVDPGFLIKLNDAYAGGSRAVQAHRIAKNRNTQVAVLDGVSEEINHSIFRRGHVNAGLSSALCGSGMAFDFNWFKGNIDKVNTVGEDKEIEMLLLLDHIHIDFLHDVPVWDEKVQTTSAFSRQRQRWIMAQYVVLSKGIRKLPKAIAERNFDYCDKIFQWILPPRVVMVGIIPFVILIEGLISWQCALKWILLYSLLWLSLGIAVPKEFYNVQLIKALRRVPLLFIHMLMNMFRFGKNDKEFLHTSHGEKE
jgi:cellulose synthase/poly-beta-1,6-N-acetylglucosamine synthase-like glycosyltransferase